MNARLVTLGLSCLFLIGHGMKAGADSKPPVVEVAQPLERTISDYETVTGRIEAAEHVDLRARMTGYLTKVHFKQGADVKKDQLLFEIDPRPYLAAFELAEAQRLLADAKLKRSAAELERAKALVKTQAISREDYDKVVADRAEAEAGREIAAAGLALAKLNLEYTKVVAPFAGKVGESALAVGNLVKADETRLASIDSVDSVCVVFNVDERTLLRLVRLKKEGKGKEETIPVSIGRAGDAGFPYSGKVDFLDNRVDAETDTIRCRAVLPNAEGMLLPGMFVRVRLNTTAPYRTLMVPEEAVTGNKLTGHHVFVVNERNVVELREVEGAQRRDGLEQVRSGLKPEDWVVVKGAAGLKAGMTVQPKRVVIQDPSAAPPQKLPEKKKSETPPQSDKLKALLQERHALLTKAVNISAAQYKQGSGTLDAVARAQRDLIESGLELAETPAERIALLRQHVKLTEAMYENVEGRFKAGLGSELEAIQARAAVLEARIRLLREEEKAKAAK